MPRLPSGSVGIHNAPLGGISSASAGSNACAGYTLKKERESGVSVGENLGEPLL